MAAGRSLTDTNEYTSKPAGARGRVMDMEALTEMEGWHRSICMHTHTQAAIDARVARAEFGLPPDASDGELVNNWPYMHARFCLPLLLFCIP